VADYTGPDSFTYRAFDGSAYSSTVTVSINVTEPSAPGDVTGLWTLYVDDEPLAAVYLGQIGTVIEGHFAAAEQLGPTEVTGTYDGSVLDLTLSWGTPGDYVIGAAVASGPNEFTGPFSVYIGGTLVDQPEFRFERVLTAGGQLALSGVCSGVTVDVNTAQAFGFKEGTAVQALDVWVTYLSVDSYVGLNIDAPLAISGPGTYNATDLQVSIDYASGTTSLLAEEPATSGTVTITRDDATGLAGTVDLYFAGGGNVTGSFDVSYDVVNELPSFNVPTASMTVDGNISDWVGISPAITDPTGDANATSGSDIEEVYVTQDASNVYVRIDLANGTPASSLYYGISFYPNRSHQAGDRFVFINVGAGACSVDERIAAGSGYHNFVASGVLAISGSVIELSVPLAALNPPAYSFIRAHDDEDGPSLDRTETVVGVF